MSETGMADIGRLRSGLVGMEGRFDQDLAAARLSPPLVLGGGEVPIVGPARIYTCGITPYDVTHLGHAATFVWADLVYSVLTETGTPVTSCRNVTDVDDVLARAAEQRGRHVDEFALRQEFLFDQDMAALRIRTPQHLPRARTHIGAVQRLAAALLATGAAYHRGGSVYFRGDELPGRAGFAPEAAVARIREYGHSPDDPQRDSPFDVQVWQPSGATDPAWPSPWGWGRPGWHAECAAMAVATFGSSVDVLAGGADLAFPHHAYQAAMVEAATGVTPFHRGHLSVGTVNVDGSKMAKSAGNLVLVSQLLEEHPPAAVRLLLLHRHWAEQWDYVPEQLNRIEQLLDELYTAAARTGPASATEELTTALLTELDVPRAVAIALEAGGETARRLVRILALD